MAMVGLISPALLSEATSVPIDSLGGLSTADCGMRGLVSTLRHKARPYSRITGRVFEARMCLLAGGCTFYYVKPTAKPFSPCFLKSE